MKNWKWRFILEINNIIGMVIALYCMYEYPITWPFFIIKYLVASLSIYRIIFTVNDKDFYKPENVGLPSLNSKGYVYLFSGLIALVLIIAH